MFWSVKTCARNHCKPLKLWMGWKWNSQIVLFVQICDSKNTCKYTHCFTIFARILLQHKTTSRLAVVHVKVSEWKKKTWRGTVSKSIPRLLNTFKALLELGILIFQGCSDYSYLFLQVGTFQSLVCVFSGCLYVGCGARQKLKHSLNWGWKKISTIWRP